MTFYDDIKKYSWEDTKQSIYSKTESDVLTALSKNTIDLNDFQALISPAASPFIEQLAQKSRQQTLKRFGNTIQLYIPLYLSNACNNACVYCGFNHSNKIERKILNEEEIEKEAQYLSNLGFEHILLVTGENSKLCGEEYLSSALTIMKKYFAQVSMEVQPLDEEEYTRLAEQKLHAVYIYQETYNETNYKKYHPKGKKSNYQYRLETPDRLGKAGIHKVGLGVLLGLEDWRTDSFFTALHLSYLEKHFWKTKYSIAFPRLRPFTGGFEPNSIVEHKDLLQLICAYRLLNEHVELSLSTRESPFFRDNLMKLGITTMSAGSKTDPGGYNNPNKELEQFAVNDDRSVTQVAQAIKSNSYEVVWKDWETYM